MESKQVDEMQEATGKAELEDAQLEGVAGGKGAYSYRVCPSCGSEDVTERKVGPDYWRVCKKCGDIW